MYRKEECGDLLSLRYDDTPETTGNDKISAPQGAYLPQEADPRHPQGTMQAKHRRIRRWDVLWAVYNCAVKFFEMYRRRVQRMDSYLKVGCGVEGGGASVCARTWVRGSTGMGCFNGKGSWQNRAGLSLDTHYAGQNNLQHSYAHAAQANTLVCGFVLLCAAGV